MKKLLISNVAYGDQYTGIFLDQHLKSMLDESNLPAHKDWIFEYVIFTDAKSGKRIQEHPNFKRLAELVPVDLIEMIPQHFDGRYDALETQLKESVKIALANDTLLSAMVADLVVARDYFTKIRHRMETHDAVFVLPLRSALEAMTPHMDIEPRALPAMELGLLGYDNLHPLWVACHWDTPQFTKLPFTLLWNSGTGLLARSFSITPIVFTPTVEMLECKMIDVDVPHLCANPYWATDWVECPVIGVEPLFCYYPPFENTKANAEIIGTHFATRLHKSQPEFLLRSLFYPCKEMACMAKYTLNISDLVVSEIIEQTDEF